MLRGLTVAKIDLEKSAQSDRRTDLRWLYNILDQVSRRFQCTMRAKQPIVRYMLNVPGGFQAVQNHAVHM